MTSTLDPFALRDGDAASDLGPLPNDLPVVERRAALPPGFVAGGGRCGIKASGRPDLAVVAVAAGADGKRTPVAAAGVFTRNAFAAAPVKLTKAHLAATNGYAAGVISTSGSANAATGPAGEADQVAVAHAFAATLGVRPEATLLMSTGVIGTRLPVDKVATGVGALVPDGLTDAPDGLLAAAEALRTTDSRPKVATTTITLHDPDGLAARSVRVSGIAKGVGMIHPGMATMLSVVVTDATVSPAVLQSLLRRATVRTWNQLTVDGDTSTNDTVLLLASGAAGTDEVTLGTVAAATLGAGIEAVARDLARQQAADGEGATTLLTCQVSAATDDADARAIARAVVSSSLVKAAIHGRDPNWGRIAGAAGNARLPDAAVLEAAGLATADATARAGCAPTLDPAKLRIAIAGHLVFDGSLGGPVPFDRAAAREAMVGDEVLIRLDLGLAAGNGEAFGCDLTEAYVIENSEYTT